jgi:hypothetical protein
MFNKHHIFAKLLAAAHFFGPVKNLICAFFRLPATVATVSMTALVHFYSPLLLCSCVVT